MIVRRSGSLAICALALAPALAQAQTTLAAVSVDSVIVTATRDPEEPPVVADVRSRLSETPGAVAVVARETYAGRFATGTADLLRDVPGVYAQKKWGGDTRLSIRGSGIGNSSHNRGTLLAQDGVPFNEADGYGDFQLIDPLIARYTEVYKGANALRFGGALLGGAINLVTPTGRNAGLNAEARIDGGSGDSLRAHVELAHAAEGWDAFAAGTALKAQGLRDQSLSQAQYGALNLGRVFEPGREVRFILLGGYVHQEIPGSLTLQQLRADSDQAAPANLANNYQRDMAGLRAALQTKWRLSDTASFEGGLYATWKDLDHPIFQVIDQESRNWGGFGRLDLNGQIAGLRADAFVGLWLRQGDLDARQWINLKGSPGVLQAQSRQNATATDLFAEARLFVTERLALVGGGTYGRAARDFVSAKVPGVATSFALAASADYDWFAPRLGLLWQGEDGAQVFANLSRSVEPPNFSALAPTAGGFSPLRTQDAWTAEVGTRGRRGPFTWDLALYRAELRGELLTYTVNVAQGVPATTFNADRTVHQGLEAGLDWRVAKGLRLRQTYAWSDFRFKGDVQYGDARLPVVPVHHYRAELRYEHASGWYLAPALEWAPKGAWADYRNTLRAPGYTVVNLSAGWRISPGVLVYLDLRNLGDRTYVSNLTAVTDARLVSTAIFFPGDGRSGFAGLTLTY